MQMDTCILCTLVVIYIETKCTWPSAVIRLSHLLLGNPAHLFEDKYCFDSVASVTVRIVQSGYCKLFQVIIISTAAFPFYWGKIIREYKGLRKHMFSDTRETASGMKSDGGKWKYSLQVDWTHNLYIRFGGLLTWPNCFHL